MLSKVNSVIISQLCENNTTDRILIDYANNVIRPFILRKCSKERAKLLMSIPFNSPELNEYAQLYVDQFQQGMKIIGKKFVVKLNTAPHLYLCSLK